MYLFLCWFCFMILRNDWRDLPCCEIGFRSTWSVLTSTLGFALIGLMVFPCHLILPSISVPRLFPAIFPTVTNKDTMAFLQIEPLTVIIINRLGLLIPGSQIFLLTFIFNLSKHVSNLKISSFHLLTQEAFQIWNTAIHNGYEWWPKNKAFLIF